MTVVEDLLELCVTRSLTITTAESCTGGMVAAAITDVPGASNCFERGFVTYSNASKVDFLGVSADTIREYGAVSELTAQEMAEGALLRAGTDLAVGITGIAGPGGSDYKPEGRVCFAIAARGLRTRVETVDYGPLGRAVVRHKATQHALKRLLDTAARL